MNINFKDNFLFLITATIGAMTQGTIFGYSSPAGVILTNNSTNTGLHLTDFQNGWFSSISNFGSLIGCPLAGFCLNYFGRRGTIIYAVIPVLIGWMLIGGGFQLLSFIGVLYVYCMGVPFTNFRWIAIDVYYDFDSGEDYDGIEKELQIIRESLEESRRKKATFLDLKKSYILKPLLMSLGLMFFEQFSGINAVLFNLALIFDRAGSKMSSNVSSIIIGVTQILGTFVAALLMDKAGRKMLLITSSSIMTVSLAALGVYFYYLKFDAEVAASVGWLPLVSLVLYVIAFSLGYGPIPWLMMGELFSPDVKELAASIALLANWIFAFITTLIYQPLTVIRFEITLFENTQIDQHFYSFIYLRYSKQNLNQKL
ncbi:hypothetical protein Avbf_12488 [Armadillidium vulgare]|nr:hypothetical protein Avbf_12488 [Armadillidium vulgare]